MTQKRLGVLVGALAVLAFAVFLYGYAWHLAVLCGLGTPYYE